MSPSPLRRRNDEADLARRAGAGDPDAYAALDSAYRAQLVRYARSLLRRSYHDAEDVVQDVLIRAHTALAGGEGPEELRPWLYRLTRNRAIDEVRRARWGDAALDPDSVAGLEDLRGEPETVLRRREAVRTLVEDLAGLPPRQRDALLAREVDGLDADAAAARLGVSVPAAQMLASRARDNLVRARDSREAPHEKIREALLEAHERGVRPTEHVLRHVKTCDACRAYQRGLRRLATQLQALAPPAGLLPLLGAAKLFGGGSKAAAAAGAAVLAVSGGVLVLASDVFESGDPAPFMLKGEAALLGRHVDRGQGLPPGTALVTARVRIPAGDPPAGRARTVSFECPAGMRVAGMQDPEQRGLPLSYGLVEPLGTSRRATIRFQRKTLRRDAQGTVGVLCRKPGSRGSLSAAPREPRPGERPARVCTATYIYQSPGRVFVGSVVRGQPVSVQRASASGKWVRVAPDVGMPGWLRASALCR